MKLKNKITPKMVKGMAKASDENQDYALLYYFTENDFASIEEAIAFYEEMEITEFSEALNKVLPAFTSAVEKVNAVGQKLNAQ